MVIPGMDWSFEMEREVAEGWARCPVCGGSDCDLVGEARTLLGFGLTYADHRCRGCGHAFSGSRAATGAELDAARGSVRRRAAWLDIESENDPEDEQRVVLLEL